MNLSGLLHDTVKILFGLHTIFLKKLLHFVVALLIENNYLKLLYFSTLRETLMEKRGFSISKTMAKRLSNYDSQESIGSKLRKKRLSPLLEMIEIVFSEKGSVNIIDIGGTEQYWSIISRKYLLDYNVSITIVNLPQAVKSEDHGPFRFIVSDACHLSGIEDFSFDIAHSNSVIEHVGDWARMVQFSQQLKRVAKKYFVQTPNYWFPIEPHCMTFFFHWLPTPAQLWIVSRFQLGHWEKATSVDEAMRIVESARLLNKAMFRALFDGSVVITERFFALPKSFIGIRK